MYNIRYNGRLVYNFNNSTTILITSKNHNAFYEQIKYINIDGF